MNLNKVGLGKFWKYICWQVDVPYFHLSEDSTHLDLGSGSKPRNPFFATRVVALDLELKKVDQPSNAKSLTLVNHNLSEPLPFSDDSIDSVSAFDLLEHVIRVENVGKKVKYPFINLMDEIFRVLKPDGLFISLTPSFPSPQAFEHPTHVNFISKGTLSYFCGEGSESLKAYGFKGKYRLIQDHWQVGAGPFEDPQNLVLHRFSNCSSRERVLGRARILWRFCRLIFRGSFLRSHRLCVLQKVSL